MYAMLASTTQTFTFTDFLTSYWGNAVAVIALSLSMLDLFLHYNQYRKECAKITIRQIMEDSFYLSFAHINKYHCAILHLSIDNKSKLGITLSSFTLSTNRGSYEAQLYTGGDELNPNGISIYLKDGSAYYNYDIKSDNLLLKNRIHGYDNVKGYLFFQFPEQIFKMGTEFATLHISTPRQKFSERIEIPKLAENLQPRHPVQ